MKTLIEIVLGLIAAYCGWVWLSVVLAWHRDKLPSMTFVEANQVAIGTGLCGILALGFLGLML